MIRKAALKLRERTPAESLDAGLILYRRFFFRLVGVSLLCYIPAAVIIMLLDRRHIGIAVLTVWWFKPLADRMVLRPLAHLFFHGQGRTPARGMFKDVLGDLLWRRFSPWRRMLTPVRILERQGWKPARQRMELIKRQGREWMFVQDAVIEVMEWVLLFGLSSFVFVFNNFIPYVMRVELTWEMPLLVNSIFAAYVLIAALLEPLGVAAGFMLYIDRRVMLEGWDLEIGFNRWAKKMDGGAAKRRRTHVSRCLLPVVLLLTCFAPELRAGESRVPEDVPMDSLQEVLSDRDFGGFREQTGFRWKDSGMSQEWNREKIGQFPAWSVRFLAVGGVLFLLGYIIWRNRAVFCRFFAGGRNHEAVSDENARPHAPDARAVPTLVEALKYHETGRFREAWAALYGVLTMLISQMMQDTPGNDATEGEWLSYVTARADSSEWMARHADGAIRILRNRRESAYAHRCPPEREFEAAVQMLKAVS